LTSFPENTLVLVDQTTRRHFYLKEHKVKKFGGLYDSRNFYWVESPEEEIRKQLAGPPNHYAYPGGDVRFSEDRQTLEYRHLNSLEWYPSLLKFSQPNAFLFGATDFKGRIIARIEHPIDGKEYLFISKKRTPTNYQPMNTLFHWQSPIPGEIAEQVPNPHGEGFFTLLTNGALIYARPFPRWPESVQTKVVLPPGSVQSMVAAHGKLFAVSNGRLITVKPSGKMQLFGLPAQLHPSSAVSIAASYSFKAAEPKLIAGKLQLAATQETNANFFAQLEHFKKALRETVLDQSEYTDALVDAYRDSMIATTPRDRVKVVLVTGPTSAGKTFGAEKFAEIVLQNPRAVLSLDMTHYADENGTQIGTHRLLGMPIGYQDQQKFKGVLPEFLRGPGRGRNVIILNEFDKSGPKAARVLMEAFDTGILQSGDGLNDALGNSVVIITANKGEDLIYPHGLKKPLTRSEQRARLSKLTDAKIRELFLRPDPNNLYDQSQVLDRSFMQRIYRAVPVGPISFESAQTVARRKAELLASGIANNGVTLAFDDALFNHIVEDSFTPQDGVRSVERKTAKIVGDILGELQKDAALLEQIITRGSLVRVTYENEKILARLTDDASVLATLAAPDKKNLLNRRLQSPSERAKIRDYAHKLKETVFGQDEAIEMTAQAMRAREMNPNIAQPVAMLFLGPTGNGKTELARAIAEVRYGNSEQMKKFDMGALKNADDLKNFFGGTRGYMGSNTMSPFERFLNDFPEGGVVVFDEIGNMGRTPQEKQTMLEVFYPILDDGSWTSPLGKVYDELRKYTFIFTGNELQEFFNDMPNDDLREAVWRQTKSKPMIESALVKNHGWPPALIGRFENNLVLFRPVTSEVRRKVSEKLVNQALAGLRKAHNLGPIEFSQSFYQKLGDTFFTHDKGARSIRGVVNNALVSLMGDAILESYEHGLPESARFDLELRDNFDGRNFRSASAAPERTVTLAAKVISGSPGEERERIFFKDVSTDAAGIQILNIQDFRRTTFHEVGHAVVNDPAKTGETLAWLTTRGTGNFAGYARYDRTQVSLTRSVAIAKIGTMLGGRMAEVLMGFEPSHGAMNDFIQATTMAEDAVLKYRLVAPDVAIMVADRAIALQDPIVQGEIQKLLRLGQEYAEARIRSRIALFRLTSARLLKYSTIDGATFKTLEQIAGDPHYLEKERVQTGCNRVLSPHSGGGPSI